jgi:hypothetical protein
VIPLFSTNRCRITYCSYTWHYLLSVDVRVFGHTSGPFAKLFLSRLFALIAKIGSGPLGTYAHELFWLAILFVMSLVGAGVVTVGLITHFGWPSSSSYPHLARIQQFAMVPL